MEQDISLIIEELKQNIIAQVNAAHLPPAVAYYLLTDIYRTVETQYFNYIESARRQLAAAAQTPPKESAEIVKED